MENQTKPNDDKETYGKIQEGFFLREHIGDGATPDGKKFELALTLGQRSPIIVCGQRAFVLSWNAICNLASASGLFENEEAADNGKK
jgi:hypothetical protein